MKNEREKKKTEKLVRSRFQRVTQLNIHRRRFFSRIRFSPCLEVKKFSGEYTCIKARVRTFMYKYNLPSTVRQQSSERRTFTIMYNVIVLVLFVFPSLFLRRTHAAFLTSFFLLSLPTPIPILVVRSRRGHCSVVHGYTVADLPPRITAEPRNISVYLRRLTDGEQTKQNVGIHPRNHTQHGSLYTIGRKGYGIFFTGPNAKRNHIGPLRCRAYCRVQCEYQSLISRRTIISCTIKMAQNRLNNQESRAGILDVCRMVIRKNCTQVLWITEIIMNKAQPKVNCIIIAVEIINLPFAKRSVLMYPIFSCHLERQQLDCLQI